MNINIRHSRKEDIPYIKAIIEEPSCYANTLQLPYDSITKLENYLTDMPNGRYSLVAELDERIVGQLGMEVCKNRRRSHVANFGMVVSEAYQSKGVGSKLVAEMLRLAIDWLAVKRIELEVYTDNDAGIALYKKHGFEIEGTARNYAFRKGEYADVYLMAKVV